MAKKQRSSSMDDVTRNIALASEEADQLRSLIADDEAELVDIRRAMSDLRSREETVASRMRERRRLLCPIRHLPNEIMAQIFTTWYEVGGRWGGQVRTANLVAQVSRHWRQIAINTPRLWTGIELRFCGQEITDEHIATAKTLLLRSQPHPIDLSVSVAERDAIGLQSKAFRKDRNLDRILECLIPSVERIKQLSLQLSTVYLTPLFNTPPILFFMPLLEELIIHGQHRVSAGLSMYDFTLFRTAPRLRHLEMSLTGVLAYDRWIMPWSQLTTLNLGSCSAAMIRPIVLQCVSLESLVSTNVETYEEDEEVADETVQIFPRLKTFELSLEYPIYGMSTSGGHVFFQPFDMPALTRFDLRSYEGNEVQDTEILITSVFARSGQTLTHLTMYNVPFREGEIIDTLRHLVVLEHLSAEVCRMCVDEFFEALTYRGTNGLPPLAPRLKYLSIFDFGFGLIEQASAAAVVDMVLSRWWADKPGAVTSSQRLVERWEHIKLYWEDCGDDTLELGEADRNALLECRAEGLLLNIRPGLEPQYR